MGTAQLLLASNRGPVSFGLDEDGALTARRGGGGLVTGLMAAAQGHDAVWVCAALSDADRHATRESSAGLLELPDEETDGPAVRMLHIEPLTFHRAYNMVANSTLWFIHHLLYETAMKPVFDTGFRREWASFVDYNAAFAEALAEEAAPGARVLVQDYHLTLAPALLRRLRPDLRIAHFSHTPWAPPDLFCLLPEDLARDVLEGILGADSAGFLSPRWADAFLDCCERVLDADVDRAARTVAVAGRVVQVGVHALGVDAPALRARAAAPDVEARRTALLEQVGDCATIVRIDRTELSKNIVRGLLAYRELLRTRPQWQGRVVHVAFAYPSRHDLPEYREYTAAVQRLAEEINEELARPGWRPVLLSVEDDYARSLAAYRVADVLLVNPVRDGMNLVAKEGPVLSDRGCALVLSTEAGAAVELGADALLVNPYDVAATAEALDRALSMPAQERHARAARLAEQAAALPPQRWFGEQLGALA
jgi:trehalose 6-phosphate synthase